MAKKFQIPALIKMGEGMSLNLSLATRFFVVNDVLYPTLKEHVAKKIKEGNLGREVEQSDYEHVQRADVISFFMVGGERVDYRAGVDMTQEDFERVKEQLGELQLTTGTKEEK